MLLIQIFLFCCLITHGHVPLPKDWINKQLKKQAMGDIYLQAKKFGFCLNGKIELAEIAIYRGNTDLPLLTANAIDIQITLFADGQLAPSIKNIALSEGSFFLPATQAENGKHTTILERISFHLLPSSKRLQIDSFTAVHENIRFRGSMELPISILKKNNAASADTLNNFYKTVAHLLKSKADAAIFADFDLIFELKTEETGLVRIVTRASGPRIRYSDMIGEYLNIQTELSYHGGKLLLENPVLIDLESFRSPRHALMAHSLSARFSQDDLARLFEGRLPGFELTAKRIKLRDIEIRTPKIFIRPQAYPELEISGSTDGLLFRGKIDAIRFCGQIEAKGNIDIVQWIPENIRKKTPDLKFERLPYCDLLFELNDGFKPSRTRFAVSAQNLSITDIEFESLRVEGFYGDGLLDFENVAFERAAQWIDLQFAYDSIDKKYRLSVDGSIIPDQYNSIMPSWWRRIFNENFSFNPKSRVHGDFIAYGNAMPWTSEFCFGFVQAKQISYADVPVDHGTLVVRKRSAYTELHELDAYGENGQFKGNIGFVGFRDGIPGLASIRYDIDARLPLESARKIFGSKIAEITRDFRTDNVPRIRVTGARFSEKSYPQFSGKSFVILTAESEKSLHYKDIPFDFLRFNLKANAREARLRHLKFGYAGGSGDGMIDIEYPFQTEAATLNIKLHLSAADYEKAIRGIPLLAGFKKDSNKGSSDINPLDSGNRKKPHIGLDIHAKGLVDNPYGLAGYGKFQIKEKNLHRIPLLGPISEILRNTFLDSASLTFDNILGEFEIADEKLVFSELDIDGPISRIEIDGTMGLRDQSLDMRAGLRLLRGTKGRDSKIGQTIHAINPLAYLLKFHLTGTLKKQKIRSIFDPRNLLKL